MMSLDTFLSWVNLYAAPCKSKDLYVGGGTLGFNRVTAACIRENPCSIIHSSADR